MTTTHNNTPNKASNAQLKRAAGSQSLDELKRALSTGWTADDIDRQEGKSALHLAAWKGCLENVQYLVDHVGCDMDKYSTGDFNYGKTALFYAATQSRVDVVEFLLERTAKVTIVNNKGQSVLSLAATHEMPLRVLERIQALELAQGEWWNFRQTHSDGLEYGDLDPRFHCSLRDTDVVTPYAVNPTTNKTRKGGFARRNPQQYEALKQQTPKKQRNQQKRRQAAEWTVEEQQQSAQAWKSLQETTSWNTGSDHPQRALRTIVTLHDQQFQPWIPDAVERLQELVHSKTCTREQIGATLEGLAKDDDSDDSKRFSGLVQKLWARFQGGKEEESNQNSKKPAATQPHFKWTKEPWKSLELQHLSMSLLEHTNSPILRMPQPPIWVHTVEQLTQLQERIDTAAVVALDTEWYDTADDKVAVSTLQVAMMIDSSGPQIGTFVVDLLVEEDRYQDQAKALVQGLFSVDTPLLGFAFGNDLPLLEIFTGSTLMKKRTDRFLDIQPLFVGQRGHNLPGLQSCAAQFSPRPLSKDQQCSEWGHRPLSQAQLDYAGLDASILLILLAECKKRHNGMATT